MRDSNSSAVIAGGIRPATNELVCPVNEPSQTTNCQTRSRFQLLSRLTRTKSLVPVFVEHIQAYPKFPCRCSPIVDLRPQFRRFLCNGFASIDRAG